MLVDLPPRLAFRHSLRFRAFFFFFFFLLFIFLFFFTSYLDLLMMILDALDLTDLFNDCSSLHSFIQMA